MFQIDLTSAGKLLLYLPGGRTVEISASAGGIDYIKKVIADHHNGVRNQRGYIGTLPTQHAVDKSFADKFLKEKAALAAKEKAKDLKAKLDIDWDRLEINL
jgi:hypothetical protein